MFTSIFVHEQNRKYSKIKKNNKNEMCTTKMKKTQQNKVNIHLHDTILIVQANAVLYMTSVTESRFKI